jgi:lipoprotein-releasing system ATP-binding protein
VAIARALIGEPRCVLADEPTGNLDNRTADAVFSLLVELQARHAMALVMVTHDAGLAARAARVLQLHDGLLREE